MYASDSIFVSDTYHFLLIYFAVCAKKYLQSLHTYMIPTCRYWILTSRYPIPTRIYLHVCVTIRRYLQLNEQYVDLTE